MTKREKIISRIILARSIGLSPDDIRVIEQNLSDVSLFVIDDFKGYNFVISFKTVPTVEEAREEIKEMYLFSVEMDFQEEFEKSK